MNEKEHSAPTFTNRDVRRDRMHIHCHQSSRGAPVRGHLYSFDDATWITLRWTPNVRRREAVARLALIGGRHFVVRQVVSKSGVGTKLPTHVSVVALKFAEYAAWLYVGRPTHFPEPGDCSDEPIVDLGMARVGEEA